MDKMGEFLENFTKILVTIQKQHEYADTETCQCGHKVKDIADWNHHIADAQARALIGFLWEK